MSQDRGPALISWARASIAQALGGPRAQPPDAPWAGQIGGTFVTLRWRRNHDLHGCIGNLGGDRTIVDDVASNAVAAATRDPRSTRALALTDLGQLGIEVSLLTPLERVPDLEAIEPGVHGVVLAWHGRRATFLPVMWETFPDKATFVDQLVRKAGIPKGVDPGDLELWRYMAERFEEPD
ncbi:MAG TPA: AmmeMemoRadiSam system protein A [Kofleriaceae bacterium]